jgi:EpsI family protein
MTRSRRFALLLVLIVAGGAWSNIWAWLGEAPVVRKKLTEFPKQLGQWNEAGGDQVIDSQTMAVLRASDYLLRDYRTTTGEGANFYVGYYASQREGATYHSPLNCLPGSGWVLKQPAKINVTPVDGSPAFEANRYVIESGSSRSILVYWYQGRGRRVANEYVGKIYTVLDSVRLRRSDAAIVRVVVPIGSSDARALNLASDLAAQAAAVLPNFVPD